MKTALVTGGAKGIGREISETLLRDHNMRVVIWGRNQSDLDAAQRELIQYGDGRILAQSIDIGDQSSLQKGLDWIAHEELEIDALVNNAGILMNENIMSINDADMMSHFMINAIGPLRLIRALAPNMVKRGYGRIVNVSSGWGSFSEGLGPGAYGLSKATLNAITLKTASELPSFVKVNSACPGWVRTSMGGPSATRSVAEGADTPVWLATLNDNGPTGKFFRNRQPIKW